MRMEATDEELLARYRAGDTEALAMLIERHRRILYGFILGMTEGREDAEEIFQEVWLRVMRKLRLYRRRNFRGWLIRLTRNLVLDRARHRQRLCAVGPASGDVSRDPSEPEPVEKVSPADMVQRQELAERIQVAVRSLPGPQREVFLLRENAGLPFREIARIQGVTINTALARMHYAVRRLREALRDEYTELRGVP